MSKSNAIIIQAEAQLEAFVKDRRISIINFFAPWAEQSKDMDEVFDELSRRFPALPFLKVEAEEFPDLSESYEVAMVPTFIIIVDGKVAQRIEGANAPLLTSTVEKFSKIEATPLPTAPTPLRQRRRWEFGSFNILADEAVRAGLKEFSNWPTFPQVYVHGELVGGLDIIKELIASGEVNRANIILFMKGNPINLVADSLIVKLLQDQSVKNEEVRAGLKEFSNWPTFPQLYIKGELVGGLDIVKEMIESGEFTSLL
ncbi:thioredoxin-like protein [Chytridium lagenaria]|nr:thioredoxin-like protein [Chytridium lagenaria]